MAKEMKSSYQRIKAENEELRRRLREVCLHPESIEAQAIIHAHQTASLLCDAIWAGDSSQKMVMTGIFKRIESGS